jgi:hypothetical protein
MPLLLNVLRNANGPDYRKLRVKAMECAGLIGSSSVAILMIRSYAGSYVAIAVGRDIFQTRTLFSSFWREYTVLSSFLILNS